MSHRILITYCSNAIGLQNLLPGYSVCHLLATCVITHAKGTDYRPERVPKFRVQQHSKHSRMVLLTFPGFSWFQPTKLQERITLHLHENWVQILKQLPAFNCFWSPYKQCYKDTTRWVSKCSAAQCSDAKYYKSQPNAQLWCTKTLKLKPPACFDPCRIIIREYIHTHQTIMYKTLHWWKHVGFLILML
jgi:hypothetical protein